MPPIDPKNFQRMPKRDPSLIASDILDFPMDHQPQQPYVHQTPSSQQKWLGSFASLLHDSSRSDRTLDTTLPSVIKKMKNFHTALKHVRDYGALKSKADRRIMPLAKQLAEALAREAEELHNDLPAIRSEMLIEAQNIRSHIIPLLEELAKALGITLMQPPGLQ